MSSSSSSSSSPPCSNEITDFWFFEPCTDYDQAARCIGPRVHCSVICSRSVEISKDKDTLKRNDEYRLLFEKHATEVIVQVDYVEDHAALSEKQRRQLSLICPSGKATEKNMTKNHPPLWMVFYLLPNKAQQQPQTGDTIVFSASERFCSGGSIRLDNRKTRDVLVVWTGGIYWPSTDNRPLTVFNPMPEIINKSLIKESEKFLTPAHVARVVTVRLGEH